MGDERLRLDVLLVELGLVESRAKAQALVMAGEVWVAGRRAEKPGQRFERSASVEVKPTGPRFASRGGEKLKGALEDFGVDVTGLTVLDIGSSTGGFTDCLLRRGAVRVYAVDVGRGQLDWRLREDPRVVVMEGVNARNLEQGDLPERPGIATLDVSFISLTKVLPAVLPLLAEGATVLPLVKPQFEAGREAVEKGGVVRDPEAQRAALRVVARFLYNSGSDIQGIVPSRLLGPKGNREFFVHAVLRPPQSGIERLEEMIAMAVLG